MQVGYFSVGIGPAVNPEFVRTIATTAERLGFSTIWAPEHVVLLEEYASKYPYSSGKFPAPADTPIADPFYHPGVHGGLHKQDSARHRYLPSTRT
jgi:alkanesulfonate monooxygenase SsuD/methylene tetrahydromethanopterin reductase-like flavin-dependent oxidoreductase (luciferase family)